MGSGCLNIQLFTRWEPCPSCESVMRAFIIEVDQRKIECNIDVYFKKRHSRSSLMERVEAWSSV